MISANLKYHDNLCTITYEKLKISKVVRFTMQRGLMANATLFFIMNLKNGIHKSKNIKNRNYGTKV
jgi:hypothetical protein